MRKLLLILAVGAMMLAGCENDSSNNGSPTAAKVGDFYYSDGTYSGKLDHDKMCVGIVFREKTATQKGLVVSLDEKNLQWSTKDVIDTNHKPINHDSGIANLNMIKQVPGWSDTYPVFRWCADQGTEWYLPSILELVLLYEECSSNNINANLSVAGGTELEPSADLLYWSSTMDSFWAAPILPAFALCIKFDCNNSICGLPMEAIGKVRAVREF